LKSSLLSLLPRFRYWTDIAIGRTAPANEGQRRYQRIIHSALSATIARGLNLFAGFISVPLAVGYLGRERYGIWVTISSLLVLLTFSDFGVGSSLLNALADAYGREDRGKAQRYVATAFWMLVVAAIVLWIPFAAASHWIAAQLFSEKGTSSLTSEAAPAVLAAITIFFVNFPLSLLPALLSAHQQNVIVNICAMITSIGNLIAIIVVVVLKGGLVWLVLGYTGCGLLVNGVTWVWLAGYAKPWLRPSVHAVDPSVMHDLFGVGWKFFVISVFWGVNLQTDNLIISHFLGPSSVTPYSISYRLLSYAVIFQSFAVAALWPAYAEAKTRNDTAWIRRTFKANLLFSFVSSIPLTTLFVVFGQKIIQLWAGDAAVPQFSLLVWMAIWNLMSAMVSVASCLLYALGRLNGMTIYGTITAAVNVVLSIAFVHRWGVNGVVFGSVLATGLVSFLPIFIDAKRGLQNLPAPA
jgi:O-antigen/teichoic acid export membrane protein